jgi:hypothetical protein
LTSALAGGEWSALPPQKEPPIPIGQEVGWTLEPVWTPWRNEHFVTFLGLELRPLGLPAHSQSLYRLLSYPGFQRRAGKVQERRETCHIYAGMFRSQFIVPSTHRTFVLPAFHFLSEDGMEWIGLIWLRIGTSGGLL